MIGEDLFATRVLPGETRCLSNIQIAYRSEVREAIESCGLEIEWRDEPNEWMCPTQAHRYGSVWSSEQDVSAFWAAYRKVRDREEAHERRRRY